MPAVDMVAFLDPKQSRIDIAQATGRAMRKPQGASTKTVGYVVVPLFAADFTQESLDKAIESEDFTEVADVLNALQEHDEDLIDIIREVRERKGAGKPFDLRRFRENVEVIGPAVDLEQLKISIGVAIADRIGSSWDEWYGRLKDYKQREGDCLVPDSYVDPFTQLKLGAWVGKQRQAKDTLSPERRKRLDALGFVWDPFAAQWEEGFEYLVRYRERNRHSLVPALYIDPGTHYTLGSWVNRQRTNQKTLSPDRRQRLDALGFAWDVLALQWEEGFDHLARYRQDKGDCLVPATYRDPASGFRLGGWVSAQRTNQKTLSPECRQRLNALGFAWDPLAAQWEEGFDHLARYRKHNGHCLVPVSYRDPVTHYRLGTWINSQRTNQKTLSPERRQRLDTLGFVWKVR